MLSMSMVYDLQPLEVQVEKSEIRKKLPPALENEVTLDGYPAPSTGAAMNVLHANPTQGSGS